MKKRPLRLSLMVLGIFFILIGLFCYFDSKAPLTLSLTSLGIANIIMGVFGSKSIYNKYFYLSMLCMIFFQVSIIIYAYLTIPNTKSLFYVAIGSIIMVVLLLIYSYRKNITSRNC